MRWGRSVLVALAVVAVPLCACMGDDDDADPSATTAPGIAATTDRVTTWFTRQSDPNRLQFTPDEAECAAAAVVDGLGVARIEELRTRAANDVGGPDEGVDLLHEPPLDADEADAVFAAMTGCIDFTAQVTELFLASGKSHDAARCMAERYVDTDVPRKAIMAADADPELMADINTALTEVETACGA
jgi:DNA-binding transcriptional LysR family regulator